MTLASVIADKDRRNRMLWLSNCWGVALILLGFGFPYLIGGLRATSLPQAYASISYIPGGQHTYGGVMVLVGLAIGHGVGPALHRKPVYFWWSRVALGTAAGLSLGIISGFGISMAIANVLLWQPMIYWGTVGMFSLTAVLFGPDPSDHT